MRTSLFLQIALLSSLSSCSFIERNTIGLFDSSPSGQFTSPAPEAIEQENAPLAPVETPPNELVAALQAPAATPADKSGVEVLWEIPAEPVDGFVIRYGYDRASLLQEKKVSASQLERFEDARFGFVYRFVLKDVEPNKPVFVSLTAFNGSKLSAPSPAFQVHTENP